MKKIYLFCLVCLFAMSFGLAKAQVVIFSSGFETWTGNVPDDWEGSKTSLEADSILPYTASVHGGTHAVELVNTESAHKRFTTQPLMVTNNSDYVITFWVRGHGSIRTGLFDNRTTGYGYATYNPYILVNSSTWTLQTQTITCANTYNAAEFILSVQYTFPDLDHIQVDDVSISTASASPGITINSPSNGSTVYSADVNIDFQVFNFVVGNPGDPNVTGHIHYTVDGGAAVMYYTTNPIALTGLTAGSHEVILQLVDNTHQPLTPNVADTATFTVDLNPPAYTPIHDIEYTTDPSGNSPFMNQTVVTGGIVTAKYASGYFIQSLPGPWNGVSVYDGTNAPALAVGDSVIVAGTVQEYFNLTEIGSVTSLTKVSSGNPVPAATSVTCLQAYTEEQWENVLVKVTDAACTSTSSGNNLWTVNDGTDSLKVHNLLFTYAPTLGTHYDITGPMYYSYNEFRILPRSAADVTEHVGTNDHQNDLNICKIYPNPASDLVTLSNIKEICRFEVYDAYGKMVGSQLVSKMQSCSLDISGYGSGIYFVKLYKESGSIYSVQFMKN